MWTWGQGDRVQERSDRVSARGRHNINTTRHESASFDEIKETDVYVCGAGGPLSFSWCNTNRQPLYKRYHHMQLVNLCSRFIFHVGITVTVNNILNLNLFLNTHWKSKYIERLLTELHVETLLQEYFSSRWTFGSGF